MRHRFHLSERASLVDRTLFFDVARINGHFEFLTSENLMKSVITKVQRFLKSEDGPTAVEYAIMLALIVIVCLTAIQAIGTNASAAFQDIADDLDSARTGTVN